MPKSTGYILHTPLQSWSHASDDCSQSLLTSDVKHIAMERSSYVIVENIIGLQKSVALNIALSNLKESGYATTILEYYGKTLIVGKK